MFDFFLSGKIKKDTLLLAFHPQLSIISQRDFIRKPSQHVPDYSISLRETFQDNCPVASDWYDVDNSKCYSILQYLEGCLLVEDAIDQNKQHNEDIQIVFVLPNDEIKYYKDESKCS